MLRRATCTHSCISEHDRNTRNRPPIVTSVGVIRISEQCQFQVPSPPEYNPQIFGCLKAGNYLPNCLTMPRGRIVGMSDHCPHRTPYNRSRHPRDPQQTTNCLLVRPIPLLFVDPLRSKVKLYGRGSLGLILYFKTINQRIYKRCLRRFPNALYLVTLESAPNVPRYITYAMSFTGNFSFNCA